MYNRKYFYIFSPVVVWGNISSQSETGLDVTLIHKCLLAEYLVSPPGRDSRDSRSSFLTKATEKGLGTNAPSNCFRYIYPSPLAQYPDADVITFSIRGCTTQKYTRLQGPIPSVKKLG